MSKEKSYGFIPLKLIRIYQVRNVGTFLPKEFNMELWFVRQMQREGHLEFNGGGYYSVTEKTQKALENFKQTLIKLDRDSGRSWKE